MSMHRIKIRVHEIRPGDVMAGIGPAEPTPSNTVVKVRRRNAGRRHDRPVRGPNAGRIRARITIHFENGARFIRDPDEITFVMRPGATDA